jgi:FAD/FMN-containing dehydrogenase
MADLKARNLDGEAIILPVADIETLAGSLSGDLVAAGHPDYETARRIWNATVQKKPALIARCRDAADVEASVNFAREHSLLLSVRGGGHNVAGNALCDGGLTIDLSFMTAVEVDPENKLAIAEGGATWRDYDAATQAHGLASTGGLISSTGVGGLTLGGGIGWLKSVCGLSCDNLVAVDLVTADGNLRHVTATSEPDLFWALRGGGGNFGVATAFTFALHEIGPTVTGGLIVHPFEAAREVFAFYREFVDAGVPDTLSTTAGLIHGPDGSPVVAMGGAHFGSTAQAEIDLAPMRAFGAPLADGIAPMEYTALQQMLDGAFPYDSQNYWKGGTLPALTPEVVEVMIEHYAKVPSTGTAVVLEQFGGAMSRIAEDATAFAHRDIAFGLLILGIWPDAADNDANVAWVRGLHDALEPHSGGGVYVNYLDREEGTARIRAAYGDAKYERLAELKTRYDSGNLFRLNQNIPPAG